jgi:hypothetical protein
MQMMAHARLAVAAACLIAAVAGLGTPTVTAQAPIDQYELADYRLTQEVFDRFVQASAPVADIAQRDPAFRYAPLFTKDVMLSGDAVTAAMGLTARLENHTALAAALATAKITAREYSKFVITLVAAHMAYGFMKSGVLPRVPSGAPTINVEFVKIHESDVATVLESLGIHD